jgi:hypothetical protein
VKRLLLLLLAVIVLVLVVRGCYYDRLYYEYEGARVAYEWGEISAGLSGNFKWAGDTEIKGSPYDLFIGIKAKEVVKGTAKVSRIEIVDENGRAVYEHEDALAKDFTKRESDGVYRASFLLENIELEYVRYKLLLKFEFETEEFETEEEAELLFERDYKEERWRNKVLDILGSA